MFPTREEALKLIRDGLLFNPGPWGKHCLTAAHCAEKIASACGDMDVEKAYILGLLHDMVKSCYSVRRMMIMPLLADILRLWRQVWKLLNGNLKKSFMLR